MDHNTPSATPEESFAGQNPKPFPVKFRDGVTRNLTVKEIKPSAYLSNVDPTAFGTNEPQLFEICTGLPASEADKLTPESYEETLAEIQRVNSGFFRYLLRQAPRMGAIGAAVRR